MSLYSKLVYPSKFFALVPVGLGAFTGNKVYDMCFPSESQLVSIVNQSPGYNWETELLFTGGGGAVFLAGYMLVATVGMRLLEVRNRRRSENESRGENLEKNCERSEIETSNATSNR